MCNTPEVILDSNDAQFSRGAQIGVLYGVLASCPELTVGYVVSRDNVENVLRVAEALGRPFRATGAECNRGCHLEFRFEAAQHAET